MSPFGLANNRETFCFNKKPSGALLAESDKWAAVFICTFSNTGSADYQHLCKNPNCLLPHTGDHADFRSIGYWYGFWPLAGALTASVYLIAAILGLPVLAGGSEKSADFALLTTPTSGFLIGFIVAAWTVGWLGELGWGKTVRWALCAMIIGTCVILLLGMFWLTLTYSWSGEQVLNSLIGLMPGAILKIALASVLVPFLWREASA